jgi:hypothetical protein
MPKCSNTVSAENGILIARLDWYERCFKHSHIYMRGAEDVDLFVHLAFLSNFRRCSGDTSLLNLKIWLGSLPSKFSHAANLKKGSPEYVDLERSGRVWENFFKPGNIEPYLQAQSASSDM